MAKLSKRKRDAAEAVRLRRQVVLLRAEVKRLRAAAAPPRPAEEK